MVVAIIAAVSFGVYVLTKDDSEVGVHIRVQTDNPLIKDFRNDIDSLIVPASSSAFAQTYQHYCNIKKNIIYSFKEHKNEPSNYSIAMDDLNHAYLTKYVEQVEFEFNGNTWSNIAVVKQCNQQLCGLFPKYAKLKEIKSVLDDYDALCAYNNRVSSLCSVQPKSFAQAWDRDLTEQLINSVPEKSGKVCNSPMYGKTRKSVVQERLFNAHTAYLNKCIELVKKMKSDEGYGHTSEDSDRYRGKVSPLLSNIDEYGIMANTSSIYNKSIGTRDLVKAVECLDPKNE